MISVKGKVLLGPMAGVGTSVFRLINKRHGADMVFSEMVSADGTLRNNKKTFDFIKFAEAERPIGIQLFGSEARTMAEAAKLVVKEAGPESIDINCGCPAKKVVRRNGGSAILKDLGLYREIVQAVVDAVAVPVSVKIRSGWRREELVALEAASIAQDCGAAWITIHPRTQDQQFSGKSDWRIIKEVKKHVSIPVVGNGDVYSGEDAKRMIQETNCDAIMVARGALGNPWIFSEIKCALGEENYQPPSGKKKAEAIVEHLEKMIGVYGPRKGVYDMRKHLGWYIKGLPGASSVRKQLFVEESADRINEIVTAFLCGISGADLRPVPAFEVGPEDRDLSALLGFSSD